MDTKSKIDKTLGEQNNNAPSSNILFDKDYLDPNDLQDKEVRRNELKEFVNKLDDPTCIETDLTSLINQNKYFFIIGSIMKDYDFGHHYSYIFREFPLGTNYKADYLLNRKRLWRISIHFY